MLAGLFKMKAKPGKKSELVDFLTWDGQVAKDTEPGTLRFEFFDDTDDPDSLWLYEAYRDANAMEEHFSHEPHQKWQAEIMDKLIADRHFILRRSESIWSISD